MAILACGPFFSTAGLLVSLFILLVVKPATYFAFIQAFRYRVSRDVPMSFKRAVWLTATRTLVGAALLGGVAIVASFLFRSSVVHPGFREATMWATLVAERLGLWLCLGLYGGLRGRRLAGWTLSGVCIDLAYDVAGGVALADQWLIHAGSLLSGVLFIALLYRIRPRALPPASFAYSPRCAPCSYDPTVTLS